MEHNYSPLVHFPETSDSGIPQNPLHCILLQNLSFLGIFQTRSSAWCQKGKRSQQPQPLTWIELVCKYLHVLQDQYGLHPNSCHYDGRLHQTVGSGHLAWLALYLGTVGDCSLVLVRLQCCPLVTCSRSDREGWWVLMQDTLACCGQKLSCP